MICLAEVELLLTRLESSGPIFGWLVFGLGALVGSFLNVVIARLPRGESIVRPGSRCPHCRTAIRAIHNVPMLSFLWLRGRCAACKHPISPRYPVIEVLTGCLFAAGAARFGANLALIPALGFMAALVAVTFIDLDAWEVPDEITLPGTLLCIVARPWVFEATWMSGVVGAALGAGFLLAIRWVYFAWRGTEAMGLGDVKLLAMIGAFLGPGGLLPTVTVGSLVGSVAGIIMLAVKSKRPETPPDAEPEEPAHVEAWSEAPTEMRLGVLFRSGKKRWAWGVPSPLQGRTYVRAGFVLGVRRGARRGSELLAGVFQNTRGWGHFEGVSLGRPPRLWVGPVLGARTADVEVYGDDEVWEPPTGSVPFGPFLSLGALATLLLAPLFGRWSALLGL